MNDAQAADHVFGQTDTFREHREEVQANSLSPPYKVLTISLK